MPPSPPRPTLTLLFTDVEASTVLVERHAEAGTDALARHHAVVNEVVAGHGGRLFERIGDAAYTVFADAAAALAAAVEIHRRLGEEDWGQIGRLRVRISLDTGQLEERDGRFFGRALYRCARIEEMARGGETLLSDSTAALVREQLPAGYRLRDLGEQPLRGLGTARVYGMVHAGADSLHPAPIRVLLVDDHEVVRRGLRGFLELLPEIEIVGEAANGTEALDAAYRLEPDVVLMDLVMPEMDGARAIRLLRARQPEVAVVALTSFAEPERIAEAVAAGAAGHLLKDADAEAVAAAVRAAAAARVGSAAAGG